MIIMKLSRCKPTSCNFQRDCGAAARGFVFHCRLKLNPVQLSLTMTSLLAKLHFGFPHALIDPTVTLAPALAAPRPQFPDVTHAST